MERFLTGDVAIALRRIHQELTAFAEGLLQPWVLAQLVFLLAAILLSAFFGARLERALEPRVRAIHGQPRLLRFMALLLRRTRWIVAALILSAALVVMRSTVAPSRSAVLAVVTLLVVAWLAISVVSRLIRNRVMARLVALVAWILVALRITGMWEEVAATAEFLAISIGEVRISLYDVVEAAVTVSVVLWMALFWAVSPSVASPPVPTSRQAFRFYSASSSRSRC